MPEQSGRLRSELATATRILAEHRLIGAMRRSRCCAGTAP